MKKIIKIGGIFLAGIIIGAALMNLLHMFVRPVFRQTMQTELKVEQEFLASRAIRNDDKLQAVLHRWNVVDASSPEGFRVFRKDKCNHDIVSSFFFPFYLFPLKMTASEEKKFERGGKIVEGIDRGKLAVALESIGQKKEADIQWEAATSLTGRKSIEETKKLVFSLLEQEKSDLYLETETAMLRDTNKVQQNFPADR